MVAAIAIIGRSSLALGQAKAVGVKVAGLTLIICPSLIGLWNAAKAPLIDIRPGSAAPPGPSIMAGNAGVPARANCEDLRDSAI
jgi:hypothetical protein